MIVQLFAINSVDLYCSGLTLQAIVPRIKRWQCVVIDTTVAGALTAIVHLLQLVQHTPDRRPAVHDHLDRAVGDDLPGRLVSAPRQHDSRSLLSGRVGIYWRREGIHIPGVVVQLIGMITVASWLDTTVW